ncbi:YegP family protein [Bacteroidales bacterium OttesenSCG-928-M11]|nr:YegP family protein [Bacteroidales bacterium OttesenSCG-928-M11]
MSKKSRFEIILRADGKYQFCLIAPNNKVLLTSESYKLITGCKNGIKSVQRNSTKEKNYCRFETKTGVGFYFVLKSPNGQVIGTSQIYASKATRENGIEAVKEFASKAEFEDSNENRAAK